MIIEYHRPETIEAALALLARPAPLTLPLGGGSNLNRPSHTPVAAVDLQALGLNTIQPRGNFIEMGATLTLQALLESGEALPALQTAIRHEAAYNLRQVATVAGTLAAADGRSPFTTAMLALDAELTLCSVQPQLPAEERLALGDLLPLRELRHRLITRLVIPANITLAYQYVARTPADRPIVCAAVAAWPSGRTRVALGGYGKAPQLVFDGTEPAGAEIAAGSAYSQAADEWASAEYRQEAAMTLVKRCIQEKS